MLWVIASGLYVNRNSLLFAGASATVNVFIRSERKSHGVCCRNQSQQKKSQVQAADGGR